jgi:hypothetical protein
MSIQPGVGYTFTSSSQGTNLNIEKPWAPWTTYATTEEPGHPFKIVNVQIVVSGGSPKVRYQVQSGTINNLVAAIDDFTAGNLVLLNRTNPTTGQPNPPTAELFPGSYNVSTKTSYIVLRSGPAIGTPPDYPDPTFTPTSNRYPQIIGGIETPTDADTWGFITIGTITVDNVDTPTTFSVNQFVTGSLWSDRIKLGTTTAKYYYARI